MEADSNIASSRRVTWSCDFYYRINCESHGGSGGGGGSAACFCVPSPQITCKSPVQCPRHFRPEEDVLETMKLNELIRQSVVVAAGAFF